MLQPTPARSGRLPADVGARFESKIEKTRACWLWTGTLNGKGYGELSLPRSLKKALAHRLAWERANGPIPVGMFVCHRCDNPRCVRPSHLFLGTQTDNMRDMSRKGRSRGRYHDVPTCVNGHPFDRGNTYHRPGGGRACRECHRQREIGRRAAARKD